MILGSEKRRSEEGGCDDVDYYTEDYEAQLLIDDINDDIKFWHEFDRDIVRSEEACENSEKISKLNLWFSEEEFPCVTQRSSQFLWERNSN